METTEVHNSIGFNRGMEPKEAMGIGMLSVIEEEMKKDEWYNEPWYSSIPDKALIWSSSKGKTEYVKYLLKIGANVHTFDDFALQSAAHGGHVEIVRMLLDAGADVHANDGYILIWAIQKGRLDVVKILLEAGMDIYAKDDIVIEVAKKERRYEILKLLESYSNKDGNNGST